MMVELEKSNGWDTQLKRKDLELQPGEMIVSQTTGKFQNQNVLFALTTNGNLIIIDTDTPGFKKMNSFSTAKGGQFVQG